MEIPFHRSGSQVANWQSLLAGCPRSDLLNTTFSPSRRTNPAILFPITDDTLKNQFLSAQIDSETGDIVQLHQQGNANNLVNHQQGAINQYLFLAGNDLAHLGRSGKPTIVIEDNGPLVASLRIESAAPGCKSLVRRIRLAADAEYLEISNTVDKERAALNPHPGRGDQASDFAQHGSKESLQFAFPFAIPDGKMTDGYPPRRHGTGARPATRLLQKLAPRRTLD